MLAASARHEEEQRRDLITATRLAVWGDPDALRKLIDDA